MEKKESKPRKLGRYTLVSLIGKGGMGAVYKATVPGDDKTYAVKVLLGAISPDSPYLERFKREAKATAKLTHAGIVKIHEFGRDEDKFFFAMDFIDGKPLDEVIEGKRLSVKAAVKAVIQVSEALEHAHDAQVVHRDIKPSNLLLDKGGRVFITDFGIARDESAATLTAEGEILGTPFYMSPEQAMGRREEIDRRSDIYSLGITLYELLTSTTPFRADDMHQLMKRIVTEDPVKPSLLNHEVPFQLETVVMKAIRKEKEKRYQSAKEFGDDLRRWLKGEDVVARNLTLIEKTMKVMKRNKGASAMGGAAAFIVVCFIAAVMLAALSSSAAKAREAAEREEKAAGLAEEGERLLNSGDVAQAMASFEKSLSIKEKKNKAAEVGKARCKRLLEAEEERKRTAQVRREALEWTRKAKAARKDGDEASARRIEIGDRIARMETDWGAGVEGSEMNQLRQEFAKLAAVEDRSYNQALGLLSNALFKDPASSEARREMAGIHFNRAMAGFKLALARGETGKIEKMFLEVSMADAAGDFRKRVEELRSWVRSKRRVSVTTDARDCELSLVSTDLDAGTESRPARLKDFSFELGAGSYIIVAEAPGHMTARYPLLVKPPMEESEASAVIQADIRMIKKKPDYTGMVWVPPGRFLMGGPDAVRGGRLRPVEVKGFLIDVTEVKHAQYKAFFDKAVKDKPGEAAKLLPAYGTDVANPGNWIADAGGKTWTVPKEWVNRPVGGISWFAAHAFANSVGKRLPTHEEWEKAARGTDGRLYPWGNRFDENRCVSKFHPAYTAANGWFIIVEADSEPRGASPYGCFHMAGNLAEWTSSDIYDHKINRGGCTVDDYEIMRCGSVDNSTPDSKVGTLGFRCAMDPVE